MKRKEYVKPNNIKCQVCQQLISPYNLTNHITSHKEITTDGYVEKYGEFRKNKQIARKGTRNIKKVQCQLCQRFYSTVGIYTHLRDTHSLTTEEYIRQFGEYRNKYISYNERSKLNDFECLICKGSNFTSHQHLSHHIRIEHKIKMSDYVNDRVFKGQPQYCKCGCNEQVKLLLRPPYRRSYLIGHSPNGMKGKLHSKESKTKMSRSAIVRFDDNDKQDTIPEVNVQTWLTNNKIEFISQYKHVFGVLDLYLPEHDLFIAVDGDYWHSLELKNLNFQLLKVAVNDFNKNKNISNLIRIGESDSYLLEECCQSLADLYKFDKKSHFPNKIDSNDQILIDKQYLKYFINTYGKETIGTHITSILNFIRTFQPEFPYPNYQADLPSTLLKISTSIQTPTTNTFNNNSSSHGIKYLKSIFKSYWNSSYLNNTTPVQSWFDDAIMYKVIKYRIGYNDSGEIFDLSLHQLLRGLSALRKNISFFKPVLAASIYKYFLGENEHPIVLDPCAGFGGRLLGFKSVYPNGKYIGIEPNIDTYNELVELSKNFKDIEIYNCKIEDFDLIEKVDLTFTSIPYWNKEIYSNTIEYENFKEWSNTFINKIKSLPNLLINVPEDLGYLFTEFHKYYIQNNTSHFNKKQTVKNELLLKFY